MSITCDQLQSLATQISLVTACDAVRDGSLRLATPFRYPDGSQIDLFLQAGDNLLGEMELSDKGQTMAYLLDLHVKPWTSQKRKQTLADICSSLGVEQEGGCFRIRLDASQRTLFADAMVRLSQVCLRAADLAYTQRLRSPGAINEDFEEFLSVLDRPYQPDLIIPGRHGKPVAFDFLVEGRMARSLVKILSTGNPAAAHTLSTEAFTRWYDIEPVRHEYQCLTVYDSTNGVFFFFFLRRLEHLSAVLAYPAETDRLRYTLAA